MESPLSVRSPLAIERRFNENEQAPISQSDVIVSATKVKNPVITLAEAEDGENLRIEHLIARNVSGSSAELRVYLVEDGGSAASAGNAFFVGTVAAGATVSLSDLVGYQLAAGERLQAFTNTSDDFIVAGRLTRVTQGR